MCVTAAFNTVKSSDPRFSSLSLPRSSGLFVSFHVINTVYLTRFFRLAHRAVENIIIIVSYYPQLLPVDLAHIC